jgi:predicted alpha/beta-hydrolase family hydrolase
MKRWAERLGVLGRVVAFEYAYSLAGRKAPDKLPKLVAAHKEALDRAMKGPREHVVLAGKSMGSRVGCHLALEDDRPSALVCFGYPLRGAGGTLRDEVLLALSKPILFVVGSRDPLCPLSDLERVRNKMRAPSALYVVSGGNHSLEVGKRELVRLGTSQADVEKRALASVGVFLDEHA